MDYDSASSERLEKVYKPQNKTTNKWLLRLPLRRTSYLYQFRFLSLTVCVFCAIPQQSLHAVHAVEKIVATVDDLSQRMAFDLQNGVSELASVFPHIDHLSLQRSLTGSFYDLAILISEAKDSYKESKSFVQGFLDRINKRNGTHVTLEKAVRKARQKMDSLSIPAEYRDYLLLGLDSMERDTSVDWAIATQAIYWPWQWNWFGLNKKSKQHESSERHRSSLRNEWVAATAFGLFCAAVVLVAIYSPATLSAVVQALITAAGLFF